MNINLVSFLSHTLSLIPPPKKTLFIAHSYSFFTQHERSPLSTPQRRRPVALVQSEGWMKTKATFNVSCMLHLDFNLPLSRAGQQNGTGLELEQRKDEKRWMESHFQDTLHSTMKVYHMPDPRVLQRCRGNDFHFSIFAQETVSTHAVCTVFRRAAVLMPAECESPPRHILFWNYPSCLALREKLLTSKSEGAGGTFCCWIVNGAFCGGIGDAGPLHMCSLAGWGAGSRGASVDGGHCRKGHVWMVLLSRGKLLQALRRPLVAHVEPQGWWAWHSPLRLLVPVEGQSAHLVRDLWGVERERVSWRSLITIFKSFTVIKLH